VSRLIFDAPKGRIEAVSTDSAKTGVRPAEDDSAHFARTTVWLLRLQALLGVTAAVAGGLVGGVDAALAVLAGAGVGIVLTAASALRTAMLPPDADAAAMVSAFRRGMMLKLVLAVVFFFIVAAVFSQWFVPVLAGYGVTLVAYWVALVRVGRNDGQKRALDDE